MLVKEFSLRHLHCSLYFSLLSSLALLHDRSSFELTAGSGLISSSARKIATLTLLPLRTELLLKASCWTRREAILLTPSASSIQMRLRHTPTGAPSHLPERLTTGNVWITFLPTQAYRTTWWTVISCPTLRALTTAL